MDLPVLWKLCALQEDGTEKVSYVLIVGYEGNNLEIDTLEIAAHRVDPGGFVGTSERLPLMVVDLSFLKG